MPPRPNGPRLSMKESLQQLDKKTLKRLLSYMKPYRFQLILVFICIAISAFASVMSSLFLQRLIDDYIAPLLLEAAPVFTGLFFALCQMAVIYIIGAFATLFYNRIMAVISQGTLKTIRDDMFAHMQTLPLKYFDTHTHGDVMSHYTNDTDTLRQMISQSFPQLLVSAVTVITVFCIMIYYCVWLTLVVVLGIALMTLIIRRIGGKSASYFISQQRAIGDVEGFVEEMMNGQKVIKVFCHERESEQAFDRLNDELFEQSRNANRYANILGPILNNIGNVLYVLVAIAGGLLLLGGAPNLSLSGLPIGISIVVPFLNMTKQFAGSINQVSHQVNAVVMGMAGAQRIFDLMDEQPEQDDGYVTLVNAKETPNGLVECAERTGVWAWKHPHQADGTTTYTRLTGDVRLLDVDF